MVCAIAASASRIAKRVWVHKAAERGAPSMDLAIISCCDSGRLRCPNLFCRAWPVLEHQDEDVAVGVEAAAGCGLGLSEGIGGSHMSSLGDEARAGESGVDVLALAVDGGIDFVGHAVIALVALEADIVRGGDAPERAAAHRIGRFPDTQVIARFDDADGL